MVIRLVSKYFTKHTFLLNKVSFALKIFPFLKCINFCSINHFSIILYIFIFKQENNVYIISREAICMAMIIYVWCLINVYARSGEHLICLICDMYFNYFVQRPMVCGWPSQSIQQCDGCLQSLGPCCRESKLIFAVTSYPRAAKFRWLGVECTPNHNIEKSPLK